MPTDQIRVGTSLLILFTALGSCPAFAQSGYPYVDIEAGRVWSGYNDVQIPQDEGTRFSLTEDLTTDPAPFVRLRTGWRLGGRHALSLLLAPLRLEASGRTDAAITYQGTRFPEDSNLEASYRFDSYRLTYRYGLHRSARWRIGIGLTAKIRDAEIEVRSDSLRATKTDTGFVPLFAFDATWWWNEKLAITVRGDALASPGGQGRAEDVFLGLLVRPSPALALRGGYRILEGGADVPEVYNFTLIHYLSFGVTFTPGGAGDPRNE